MPVVVKVAHSDVAKSRIQNFIQFTVAPLEVLDLLVASHDEVDLTVGIPINELGLLGSNSNREKPKGPAVKNQKVLQGAIPADQIPTEGTFWRPQFFREFKSSKPHTFQSLSSDAQKLLHELLRKHFCLEMPGKKRSSYHRRRLKRQLDEGGSSPILLGRRDQRNIERYIYINIIRTYFCLSGNFSALRGGRLAL